MSVHSFTEKKDLSPSEEWGVDEKLISKLKEQYQKERKGKKGIQSMNGCSRLLTFSLRFCDLLLVLTYRLDLVVFSTCVKIYLSQSVK